MNEKNFTSQNLDDYSYDAISRKEKISYGLGDAATAFVSVTFASFAMYFFTDVVGVSAAILGNLLMVSRIFDCITNVALGRVVDLTNTKYGKARPWVARMIIPLAVSLVLMFLVPNSWSVKAKTIYIIVTVNIYFLAYTASNIPYGTLGTLISRNSQVRSELNLLRMIGYFGMSTLIGFATVPIVNKLGGGQRAWIIMMSIYAIIMALMFIPVFTNTRERVGANNKDDEKVSFKDALKMTLKNKYWDLIFFIMVFGWILTFLFQGINIYYAQYIMHNDNYTGILTGLYNGALLFGFLTINFVFKRLGRRKTIVIGQIVLIISSLTMLLFSKNIVAIGALTVLRGLGFSPLMGTAYAMLADTIDYGEWKYGKRNEGVTYSGGTFSTTLGTGIASAGIGWVLALGGYIEGGVVNQPASVYTAINFLFIIIPVIISAILIVLFYFYDLDNFHDDILKELKEKN